MPQPAENSSQQPGAIRLFRLAGINVFLHWSWGVVAVIELQSRNNAYVSAIWNLLEYVSLFGIVLLHEFGHALACRSVGGKANRIVLWPLGGIAFVSPPRRPGAVLWSIAAGPLVNVVLVPLTLPLAWFSETIFPTASPSLHHYLSTIATINIGLLIFNMLPVYPLDGGQILQSILWFFLGEHRSLRVAASIGLVAATGAIIAAAWFQDYWLIIMALFVSWCCWNGLKYAKQMATFAAMPRRAGAHCPACQQAPPVGTFWRCHCGQLFDTFEAGFRCPNCGTQNNVATCPYCGTAGAAELWYDGEARVVSARVVSEPSSAAHGR